MLLNRPLFPGGGQLAILLAIRDCKIDALEEIKPRLPPGLFEVMQKGLSRDPATRYASATEFATALAPFEADVVLPPLGRADDLGALERGHASRLPAPETTGAPLKRKQEQQKNKRKEPKRVNEPPKTPNTPNEQLQDIDLD